VLYLIHFDQPFGHAQHYLGFCEDGHLEARVARHRAGNGARLMARVTAAGIGWQVVRTWKGDRKRERRFKKRSHRERCPICRGGWKRPNSVQE